MLADQGLAESEFADQFVHAFEPGRRDSTIPVIRVGDARARSSSLTASRAGRSSGCRSAHRLSFFPGCSGWAATSLRNGFHPGQRRWGRRIGRYPCMVAVQPTTHRRSSVNRGPAVESRCRRQSRQTPGPVYRAVRSAAGNTLCLGLSRWGGVRRTSKAAVVAVGDRPRDVVGPGFVSRRARCWVASGHVAVFNDPARRMPELVSKCSRRIIPAGGVRREEAGIDDPEWCRCRRSCVRLRQTRGQWTEPRDFNMMLKTYPARSRPKRVCTTQARSRE